MLKKFKRKKSYDFKIEVLKAGYIYIILTILFGIAGVNTGNNLIYLIVSAMLSFMGLSGYLGKLNLKKLDIDVTLPEEVFAKVETPILVKVKNSKRFFPTFLLRVYVEDKNILIPFVDTNTQSERHILVKYENRGERQIKEIKVCSVFPFNFFRRCVTLKLNRIFTVYPFPKKCNHKNFYDSYTKTKGDLTSTEKGNSGDLIGIRDYTIGDSLKYIHWKATAKTGELKTKELTSNQFEPILIDIDQLKGSLEERISCATYLILKAFKSLQPFGLKAGKTVFKPEYSLKQKVKLLKFLAKFGNIKEK